MKYTSSFQGSELQIIALLIIFVNVWLIYSKNDSCYTGPPFAIPQGDPL